MWCQWSREQKFGLPSNHSFDNQRDHIPFGINHRLAMSISSISHEHDLCFPGSRICLYWRWTCQDGVGKQDSEFFCLETPENPICEIYSDWHCEFAGSNGGVLPAYFAIPPRAELHRNSKWRHIHNIHNWKCSIHIKTYQNEPHVH